MNDLESEVKNIQREYEEYWKEKARAAGWSPPVPSRLRAVVRCPNMDTWQCNANPDGDCCEVCHGKGTFKRELTPTEINEVAEVLWAMVVKYNAEEGNNGPWHIDLLSGLKVILVEDSDENHL